jgi:hypothetical protein
MLYLPLQFAFALILMSATQSLTQIYATTFSWMKEDAELAQLGDRWAPRLNKILALNKNLSRIELLCQVKADPSTLASLRLWAQVLHRTQNLLWRNLEIEMQLQKLKGKTQINAPKKGPKGLCIEGLLNFNESLVFSTERAYAGMRLSVENSQAQWQFRHSRIKRRL